MGTYMGYINELSGPVPKSDLAKGIIWSSHWCEQSGQEYDASVIASNLNCTKESVEYQFSKHLSGVWINRRKDGNWKLRKDRERNLKRWIDSHLNILLGFMQWEEFVRFSVWVFDEIRKDRKSMQELKRKIAKSAIFDWLISGSGPLVQEMNALEFGIDRFLYLLIEAVFRFFGSYVDREFIGWGKGEPTFYYRSKDAPAIISDQWTFFLGGRRDDGTFEAQEMNYVIDLDDKRSLKHPYRSLFVPKSAYHYENEKQDFPLTELGGKLIPEAYLDFSCVTFRSREGGPIMPPPTFTLPQKYEDQLNRDAISKSLRKVFGNMDEPLPENASIKRVSDEWRIAGLKKDYIIRKAEGNLEVYSPLCSSCRKKNPPKKTIGSERTAVTPPVIKSLDREGYKPRTLFEYCQDQLEKLIDIARKASKKKDKDVIVFWKCPSNKNYFFIDKNIVVPTCFS